MHAQPIWISEQRCALGESPIWDGEAGALYWIDIANPAVYRLAGSEVRRYPYDRPIGSIFLAHGLRVLVALRKGMAWLDLRSGVFSALNHVPPGDVEQRLNDGRCDCHGRLWISTMDRHMSRDIGMLIEVDSTFGMTASATHALIGNGVCFSPDDRTLYFSDSRGRAIYRYDKPAPGQPLGLRTLFAALDEAPGRPDGCTVDAQGCLWSARVGGGRIDRYAPDGTLLDALELPVTHPTHCAFAGADLDTLYVTTMRHPPNDDAFADQPLAGAVLAYRLGVRGLPEHRFAG